MLQDCKIARLQDFLENCLKYFGNVEDSLYICNQYYYNFHETYPECEADENYPPTVENVDSAFTRYGVVKIGSIFIKTEWDGEIEINY